MFPICFLLRGHHNGKSIVKQLDIARAMKHEASESSAKPAAISGRGSGVLAEIHACRARRGRGSPVRPGTRLCAIGAFPLRQRLDLPFLSGILMRAHHRSHALLDRQSAAIPTASDDRPAQAASSRPADRDRAGNRPSPLQAGLASRPPSPAGASSSGNGRQRRMVNASNRAPRAPNPRPLSHIPDIARLLQAHQRQNPELAARPRDLVDQCSSPPPRANDT
ncbi:hypothetical protein [Xanthomonas theicola]|uniref:hypothetical protein n=1 Tax=Xanthomonas theicola TaxID=56464 RepID=UPI000FF8A1ED|nr:hypothetical protein [Xanthomonas theicola]QNH23671.1 hypothetical protein G4Q83_01265 [Xanthomonas theicola]